MTRTGGEGCATWSIATLRWRAAIAVVIGVSCGSGGGDGKPPDTQATSGGRTVVTESKGGGCVDPRAKLDLGGRFTGAAAHERQPGRSKAIEDVRQADGTRRYENQISLSEDSPGVLTGGWKFVEAVVAPPEVNPNRTRQALGSDLRATIDPERQTITGHTDGTDLKDPDATEVPPDGFDDPEGYRFYDDLGREVYMTKFHARFDGCVFVGTFCGPEGPDSRRGGQQGGGGVVAFDDADGRWIVRVGGHFVLGRPGHSMALPPVPAEFLDNLNRDCKAERIP